MNIWGIWDPPKQGHEKKKDVLPLSGEEKGPVKGGSKKD